MMRDATVCLLLLAALCGCEAGIDPATGQSQTRLTLP
jgi:hypothetical protein